MPNYIQKSINESLDIITQKKSCELVRIYHEIKKDLHLKSAVILGQVGLSPNMYWLGSFSEENLS